MREIADTIKEANKLRAELGMPLLEEVDEATVAAAAARDTPAAAPPQQTDEEAALAAQKDQQTLEVMAKIEKYSLLPPPLLLCSRAASTPTRNLHRHALATRYSPLSLSLALLLCKEPRRSDSRRR
jgi:hypothetical protein